MSDIDLGALIPRIMQTDFYLDFLDAWNTELELYKADRCTPKLDLLNARELDTVASLQNITNMFGYYPDTSINGSVDFFKSEINSIAFRIKRKTTYPGYDYIFKSIPIIGYVYNLLWDDTALVKAWDEEEIETYLASHDLSTPFTDVIPDYYYSFFEDQAFTLDDGHTLDEGLYLDTNVIKEATHHLAIEVVPVSLSFTVDSTEPYLMTADYLDYIQYYVNYNRKVTEIPHVGVQLNLITDTSRYYNNLNGGLAYTVPDLHANFAVTQNWNWTTKEEVMYYICAGVGVNQMYGVGDTLGDIDSLDEEIYSRALSTENEDADTGDYYKLNTYIPTGTVKNLVLFVGDGVTYQRSGFTKYSSIIQKSFNISYYANNESQSVTDDGLGVLESDTFIGSIDYDTGEFELNFVNAASEEDSIAPTGDPSTISGNLSYNTVQLDTVEVAYTYNGDHIARSDAFGNITGDYVTSGTVTREGVISVSWSVQVTSASVTISYDYDNFGIPTNGYPVYISYRTEEVVRIREIGIKDPNGILVAYGVIPATYCPDRLFHLSLNIFIKKP